MKLSAHFDLCEFTRSESAKREGVSNMPTPEHLENIKTLCEKVLEPIRAKFGPKAFLLFYLNSVMNININSIYFYLH